MRVLHRLMPMSVVMWLTGRIFVAVDMLMALVMVMTMRMFERFVTMLMPIKSILIVTHNIEEAVLLCDRLDPPFRALVDDIYARMTARQAQPQPPRDGLFPGTGISMVLPRVSTNSLAGLIEEVDGTPFDGSANMAELADSLQLDVDELLSIAETLQLLRFGVETTTKYDRTARSATNRRFRSCWHQRHTARPDANTLENARQGGPETGSSSVALKLEVRADQK